MKVVIEVISGPDAGASFEFEGGQSFVLGRATQDGQGLKLPKDPYFSRYHMLFEFARDGCVVRDLRSRNGVFVNGVRVADAVLADGDEIEAGRTKMQITIRGTLELATQRPERYDVGSSVGQFEIGEVIGEGAFGRVYDAHTAGDPKPIALKILRSEGALDDDLKDYFVREIKVMSELDHPHVVKALGAGRHRDDLWLAMEKIDAPNLETIVESSGTLAVADAVEIGTHLLEAVLYAHAKGIVHRDVKPSNVLVSGEPGSYWAKIGDFGLAKSYRNLGYHPLTGSGEARGTPHFMPPEQVLNAKYAGPPADIYGFGATMYWALANAWHVDESAEDGNVWRAILLAPHIPITQRRPDLPAELGRIIDRSLERDESARFDSAVDVLRAWNDVDRSGAAERTRW